MKIINNCLIFNAEEAAIVTDSLNENLNQTVTTLDSKKVTDMAATDDKARKMLLGMIGIMRQQSALLGEIEDSGWWPKTAVHKHHYFSNKEFRDGLFRKFDNEGILKLFIDKNNQRDNEEKK